MKKLTSLLLCIVMLMSLAVTAFAAVDEGATTLPSNAAITMATNSTNASADTGTPYRWGLLKDGVISTEGSKVPETYATNAIFPAKGESAWVTVDLGEEYSASLSGLRLYNRFGWAGWPSQAISKAYIYLSDDGENWIRSDLATVSNSTRYANIALKFNGTVYDAKARYIRLEAVQVGGNDSNPHWGMEELELLNVSGEAKTVTEIKTAVADSETLKLPAETAITMGATLSTANIGNLDTLKDGIISTEGSKVSEAYATNAIYPATGSSAWIDCDLGKSIDYGTALSGVRLYNRFGWANQAISKAYLYLSDDGENWIKSDLVTVSNSTRYADIALKFNGTVYDAKARYIRLEAVQVGGKDNEQHWGMEELELLNVSGEAKTIGEIKTAIIASEAESAKALINAINTRVTGSIENVNTINAARAAYDGLSAEAKSLVDEETLSVLTNAENALSGVVKEIDTTPGSQSKISVTGISDHKNDSGNNVTLGNPGRLTDGLFSPNGEVGNSYYSAADFAVYPDANEYLHLTVTMTEAQNVSGIRFYTRKAWNSANLNKNNNAKSAKVTLYSGDAYVTSDIITLTQSSDIIYCDAALKFNSEPITVTNVTKIEIIVLENIDQAHWGAEELRLLETNGTQKSVSDIAKTLVTLSTPTFESGVYGDGTGIIRFFTTFDAIADGAEIESFGTYAHVDSVSADDKCATYEGKTPAAGDNFSVDVTGITEGYFNKPVFALSFVKIKGYDNLILSGISTGATVDTKNELK